MIKIGSTWERVGKDWVQAYLGEIIIVESICDGGICYRYADSFGHVGSYIEEHLFLSRFKEVHDN